MTLFRAPVRAHKAGLATTRSTFRGGQAMPRRKWAAIADRSHLIPKVRVLGTLTLARSRP
jgi:hypothetical protein